MQKRLFIWNWEAREIDVMRIRFLTCLFCLLQVPGLAAQDRPLLTNLSLVIGYSSAAQVEETSQLLDSSVVILMPDPAQPETPPKPGLKLPLDVPGKLKKTLTLKRAEITRARLAEQQIGQVSDLLALEKGDLVGASVELLNRFEGTATFRVLFRNGDSILSETRVAVELGKRAVVGALGGTPGTYLFLVVNPLSLDTLAGQPEKPILLEIVLPRYLASDVAARLQGRVKVSGTVNTNGFPSGLEVLETPAESLSASALEAIQQWRYRPAEDGQGRKIEVQLTWTLAFVLE